MTQRPDPTGPPPDAGPDIGGEGPMLTYADAPDSLIALWMKRRKRMDFAPGEALPPLDVPLQPLLDARIPADPPPAPARSSRHGRKLYDLRVELQGLPELAALNAILISHLRKRRHPREAPPLFRRIWTEAGPALMPLLPGRWLISSVITFGEHGETEAQRRIGLGMNVFFSMMKLYEYERCHSGHDGDRVVAARRLGRRRLPLDMPPFALVGGGLDINLLAQIWNEARAEPVAGRLACHLLDRLNADPRNLFRRIGMMRAARHLDRLEHGASEAFARRGPEGDPPE